MRPEEMGPKRTAVADQLESGLMSGIVATKTPAVGVETSDAEVSSISFFQGNNLSSVDDIDLTAGRLATVYALLGAEGSFGVKGSADRLLPDLIAPAERRQDVTWIGFPVGIAVALLVVPAGVRGLLDAGLVRENWRGRALAFPLGAVLATAALVALAPLAFLDDRGDLELLDPDLRRWMPYLLGIVFLGFLDDALGRGERAGTPRGWRGHARALREGRLSTGAIKAIGALALAAYVVSGRGLESWRYLADVALLILATNCFNLLDLRPGRAEKGLALLGAGLCLGAWTLAPIELLGIFAGAVAVGAWFTLRRAGDAGRHRLQPGRGDRRRLAADLPGRDRAADRPRRRRRTYDFRRVAFDFRGRSKVVPPLRWLDSLGRE